MIGKPSCSDSQAAIPAATPTTALHYPDDPTLFAVQDEYLYGADMLVAPVIEEGAIERRVVLPGDAPWRHVWSGEDFVAGEHIVAAPATARRILPPRKRRMT